MARRLPLLAALALVLLIAGCGEPELQPVPELETFGRWDPDLTRLVSWMSGSFSSAKQAASDPAYFPITLVMVPIWTDRDDAKWLYVEQALEGSDPYRQRVYRVTRTGDGIFESRVYELPDPKAAIGAHEQDAPLADLSPGDLIDREGCAVILEVTGEDSFAGSTKEDECKSDFRGAAYATSVVEVFENRIISWDRGYDTEGTQVWGAEKGGYVFDKLPPAK